MAEEMNGAATLHDEKPTFINVRSQALAAFIYRIEETGIGIKAVDIAPSQHIEGRSLVTVLLEGERLGKNAPTRLIFVDDGENGFDIHPISSEPTPEGFIIHVLLADHPDLLDDVQEHI